jgi:hypothetical protein
VAAKLYETGDLWSEAWRLLVAAKGTLGAYLVILTATETIADQLPETAPFEIVRSVITLFLGYCLIVNMLYFGRLAPGGVEKGLLAYLGLVFLFVIMIGIGWVAFVFPALYLAIRLAPLLGYGMGEVGGLRDAFGRSWNATKGHFWEIAGAMFVPLVLLIIAFGITEKWTDDVRQIEVLPSFFANLVIAAASATTLAIGLGVYAAARNRV